MGNQLSAAVPSQIFPVEHYFTDISEYDFVSSLGSTRFFKVARAKYKEGPAVVKVFVIHDPSLPLKEHWEKIEDIANRLKDATNCLLFRKAIVNEKAAVLVRQYVKDSLYDRISTRPFLTTIEKKWISFQLLCALNTCHKAQDNPGDYSYFFDASRRRTCYIAPERFVASEVGENDTDTKGDFDINGGNTKKGELSPEMDIFSVGCVIAELFLEGSAPFDFSQLLLYRKGDFDPSKFLNKIDDSNIRELVTHMTQIDPNSRLTADEYLQWQRGMAFPEHFYSFLKLYLEGFVASPLLTPDDRIERLLNDFDEIVRNLELSKEEKEKNEAILLPLSLVTASIRNLQFCASKLSAILLFSKISDYISSDIMLDRIIPFMLVMLSDTFPRIRCEALRFISKELEKITDLKHQDSKVFQEYILPAMNHLTHDRSTLVRATYAEHIAILAETAMRFLEFCHMSEHVEDKQSSPIAASSSVLFENEVLALHDTMQRKLVTLLSDSENVVKHTLLQSGITRLCVFFGRQKANDILLSHMITFLNDKRDWQLRGAFFDSLVGVAAYVGWQCASILKPLLQQGLGDPEEFVICKTLAAMTSLVSLGLLGKPFWHELLKEVAPFLVHPGLWIRLNTVGFVAAAAKMLNIADIHCNLLPLLQRFFKCTIMQLDKEVVVLGALKNPIPRNTYDYLTRLNNIDQFFNCLQHRQLQRNSAGTGSAPRYPEMDNAMSQIFRKLTSQGLVEDVEDLILTQRQFLTRLSRLRAASVEQEAAGANFSPLGVIDVSNKHICRYADLARNEKSSDPQNKKSNKRQNFDSQPVAMNDAWNQMFGSPAKADDSAPPVAVATDANPLGNEEAAPEADAKADQQHSTGSSSIINRPVEKSPNGTDAKHVKSARFNSCHVEFHDLLEKRRHQYVRDVTARERMSTARADGHPPTSGWRPKGLLIAHLHEHRSAVNRIRVNSDRSLFVTCSNDGSVKLWESAKMDGKSVLNRSRVSYRKQGGQIKSATFCDSGQSVASASDNGSIQIIRFETGNVKPLVSRNLEVDLGEHGQVVDMTFYDEVSQSVIAYATANGQLLGWDLRQPPDHPTWCLQNDPKLGLTTCFDVHHQLNWLVVGTTSGIHTCWDMRFRLPITTVRHPAGARIRRVQTHPSQPSWIVSAVQGNNEISTWNLETGSRQQTLWTGSAPALSTTYASPHSTLGLYMGETENSSFLLTGGTDMRIRFWDLKFPSNSAILVGAATDPKSQAAIFYKNRLVEGTEVIQESYSKPKSPPSEDVPRRGPDPPPPGHHDIITDLNIIHSTQHFVVSASRDGVVKVWK